MTTESLLNEWLTELSQRSVGIDVFLQDDPVYELIVGIVQDVKRSTDSPSAHSDHLCRIRNRRIAFDLLCWLKAFSDMTLTDGELDEMWFELS